MFVFGNACFSYDRGIPLCASMRLVILIAHPPGTWPSGRVTKATRLLGESAKDIAVGTAQAFVVSVRSG